MNIHTYIFTLNYLNALLLIWFNLCFLQVKNIWLINSRSAFQMLDGINKE